MTQETPVLFEQRGAVALVTLNRPQSLNSFTRAMHDALWESFERINGDKSIRALVLTGATLVQFGGCVAGALASVLFEIAPLLL